MCVLQDTIELNISERFLIKCARYMLFLLSGFSFTNIHDSQDSIGRRKGVISSTLLCHFNPLHRHLAISQAITAENSLLRISSSRNRSGTFGFQDQVPNH